MSLNQQAANLKRQFVNHRAIRREKLPDPTSNDTPTPPAQPAAAASSQRLAAVTSSGLNRDIFDVIQALKADDSPLDRSGLIRALGRDIFASQELLDILKQNERIIYDPVLATFAYRHTYSIKNKDDLLKLILDNKEYGGMDYKEVKESYSAIAPALKELEEAGSVLVIRNKDATPRLLFHNDAQQNINISSEFRRMWREIEIPKTDTDLQKELKNAGLTSLKVDKIKPKQQSGAGMKKKRGSKRRAKITNTHLDGIDFTKDVSSWS